MNKTKKILRFFLGIPITILSFLFIAKILFDARGTISSAFTHINPIIFLLGIFFYALFFMLKSFVWIEILKKRGFTPEKRETIFYYQISEIKRYIPGNIFAFMARIRNLETIPKREVVKGIAIEAMLLTISAFIFSLPGLGFYILKTVQTLHFPSFLPIIILVTTILIVATVMIYKFFSTITSFFDSFMLFMLGWFFYALGSFFVAISFSFINPHDIIFILSLFVLSWLAGYVLFVTPMGLGVRELALTATLSLFIPLSFATVIAVLTRIAMILGELLFLLISLIFKNLKESSKILKINPYVTILISIAIAYFIYFNFYTFARHDDFLSGRFDLGNMVQTVWNTAHGSFFSLTDPDGTKQISRLADHADFIMVIFAPLFYIWNSPKVLLFIQTFVLSFGGIFVYLISQKVIKKEKISLLLAVSFYLNFWVQEQNIFDFHAVALATTFLLAAYYFLIRKRYFYFAIFLILSVLTKENVYLVAAIFGLFFIFKLKKRLTGILLFLVSLFSFYFLVAKAIPAARGSHHFALDYYSYLGNSLIQIVGNAISKPWIIFQHLVNFSTVIYLFQTLIPTGFLSIFAPLFLIFTIPDILINLLSKDPNLHSYQYHYGAVIVPFIYISAIYGISFIFKKIKIKNISKIIFYYLIFATLISIYFFSPLPGTKNEDIEIYNTNDYSQIYTYLSVIPKDATVAASNRIAAHLSLRKVIYVLPNGMENSDFIVFYKEKENLISNINPSHYKLILQDPKNGFYLFKKIPSLTCRNCEP
jgi:uncharacterized membrane protein/uncharacterized membrane protein YbhN (UPF0104 family)